MGLRAADLVFDPTLACREGDAPAPAAQRRAATPNGTVLARIASSPPAPDSRGRSGQGLPLSRTMLSDHKSPYVGRFACDWPRLSTTDPHAAHAHPTPGGCAYCPGTLEPPISARKLAKRKVPLRRSLVIGDRPARPHRGCGRASAVSSRPASNRAETGGLCGAGRTVERRTCHVRRCPAKPVPRPRHSSPSQTKNGRRRTLRLLCVESLASRRSAEDLRHRTRTGGTATAWRNHFSALIVEILNFVVQWECGASFTFSAMFPQPRFWIYAFRFIENPRQADRIVTHLLSEGTNGGGGTRTVGAP
jgi:hypothetical protein